MELNHWDKMDKWDSKTIFLEAVDGNKIVEEQDKINISKDMFVYATQIEKRWTNVITEGGNVVVQENKDGHLLYDVLMYYKVNPECIEQTKEEIDKKYNVKEIGKPKIDKNIF